MEYRQLGRSGLKVPELCFGAGTFGANNEFFMAWSETSQEEADRIVGICMDAGLNFFDTADIYSNGSSEEALGKALSHHKREDVLISTKTTFRFGEGPNNTGSSRYHMIQQLNGSLKRLGTDYIDVYHMHAFDALTPVDLFNVSPGQTDPFLNVFIRQPIPSRHFIPAGMEALIDVRNLLAQGYRPVMGQDGQTVYLVQTARSIRGGLAFTF